MAYPGIALVAMVGVGLGLALWYFLTDTTNEPPHGSGPSPRRDTPPPNNSWDSSSGARRRRPRNNSNSNCKTKDDCPICTELMDDSAETVKCGHVFHISCIKKWREAQGEENRGPVTCPLCRRAI